MLSIIPEVGFRKRARQRGYACGRSKGAVLVSNDDAAAKTAKAPAASPVGIHVSGQRNAHDRMTGPATIVVLKAGESQGCALNWLSARFRIQKHRQRQCGCE